MFLNLRVARRRHQLLAIRSPDADHHDASRSEIRLGKRLIQILAFLSDLQIDQLQFVATVVGDLQEVLDTGVEHEAGHTDRSGTERADDASGSRAFQLFDGFFIAGPGDDFQFAVEHRRRQYQVQVIGVGLEHRRQRLRPLDSGANQRLVRSGVADDVRPAKLRTGFGDSFFVDVDHDERLATFLKVMADGPAHSSVAADDRVALHVSDLFFHATSFKNSAKTCTDQPAAQLSRAVREDAQSRCQVKDDEEFSRYRSAAGVLRPDRRQRDNGFVETVQPRRLRPDQVKADRAGQRQQKQQTDGDKNSHGRA